MTVSRFPLHKTRALPDATSGPAAAEAAAPRHERGGRKGDVAPAAPPPTSHNLFETAAALVSISRTALSGDFTEAVHAGARKVASELNLIVVREHDRALMRACTNLVTSLTAYAESDPKTQEAWACVIPVEMQLVRIMLRSAMEKAGLR